MDILFPTLIVAVFRDRDNLRLVKDEVCVDLLVDFLKGKRGGEDGERGSGRMELRRRFPVEFWDEFVERMRGGNG